MRIARRVTGALALGTATKLAFFPHRVDVAWDLDGTLITHQRGRAEDAQHVYPGKRGTFSLYLRPSAPSVLKLLALAGNRQVLFTAATQGYADSILNALLPGLLPLRLYRDSLTVATSHGKDLSRVAALLPDSCLACTVLVDDQPRNRVGDQHFIYVRPWVYGAPEGTELWRAAAVILFANLVGPQLAFSLLRGALAPPTKPASQEDSPSAKAG